MAGHQISSRADLQTALAQGAELEQQLSLQYLYAAFSLRWTPATKGSPDDEVAAERARASATVLMGLARQEMEHQGIVSNILSAVGGCPTFQVPAMPTRMPFGGEAELTPFSDETLLRMLGYERPDDITDPTIACSVPAELRERLGDQAQEGSTVLDHYSAIYSGLIRVADTDGPLVTGGVDGQVTKDHEYGVTVDSVVDLNGALTGIDQLALEGEGASAASLWWGLDDDLRKAAHRHGVPDDGPPSAKTIVPADSHFCRLVGVWKLAQEKPPPLTWPGGTISNATLDPGRSEITNEWTQSACNAFSLVYGALLDSLTLRYDGHERPAADASSLDRTTFFRLMTMGIRPLGMVIARAPADHADGPRAGPVFDPRQAQLEPDLTSLVGAIRGAAAALQQLSDEFPDGYVEPELGKRLLDGVRHDVERIAYDLASESASPLPAAKPEGVAP